jgi:hypothetical protein
MFTFLLLKFTVSVLGSLTCSVYTEQVGGWGKGGDDVHSKPPFLIQIQFLNENIIFKKLVRISSNF